MLAKAREKVEWMVKIEGEEGWVSVREEDGRVRPARRPGGKVEEGEREVVKRCSGGGAS